MTINNSLNLSSLFIIPLEMRKIYINLGESQGMQITFIQTTAALAIAIIALFLLDLVSTYTTNSEAAGQGISENVFQLSAKLDNSVNPPF
jgi:hypothetical protein